MEIAYLKGGLVYIRSAGTATYLDRVSAELTACQSVSSLCSRLSPTYFNISGLVGDQPNVKR
jgi:hypothetical protein